MKYDKQGVGLVLDMKDLNNCEWEQRVLYMLFSALQLFVWVLFVGGQGPVLSVFTIKLKSAASLWHGHGIFFLPQGEGALCQCCLGNDMYMSL